MAIKSLVLNQKSKASDALELPEGNIALDGIEVSISPEAVVKCAQIIIEKKIEKEFHSQAGVVAYAGNTLGWGAKEGYVVF